MNDLKYEFYMAAEPEKVWNALISPEATKQIYWGSVIRSNFNVGDSIEYVGPGVDGEETVHIYGKVLEFVPNQVFRFTHIAGKSYVEGDHEYESRISYLLEPVGKCTRLTLIQDQWEEGDPSYTNTNGAWWMILSNTKTLIETGRTLEFET